MKTYVLMVSRVFPSKHKRKGEPTYFVEKLNQGVFPEKHLGIIAPKITTIRSNYELWKKRIDEVNEGKAILSLRYWSGKPYCSKQVEFARFDKDSGIGIQELYFLQGSLLDPSICCNRRINPYELIKNDGLNNEDFFEWFKDRPTYPMAIIHFTKFRY